MDQSHFIVGHESELRELIENPRHKELHNQLRSALCIGMDSDAFHPESGRPDELVLARCHGCPVRLVCLALALREEDPDIRCGWYGGLGPDDRDKIAAALNVSTPEMPLPDRVIQSVRLKAAGWTIGDIAAELGCSRRTVQRYLRTVAA
jgi:AraC-like DNA-binding protein